MAATQTTPAKRMFTVDEYYRMAEAGVLGPEERVELLDGEIFSMSPQGPVHAAIVSRFAEVLVLALERRASVRSQVPARLDDLNEPEPDITLNPRRDDDYASGHPGPNEVLLAVEVADSSRRFDRVNKVPRYARFGIPEVWLVDIPAGVLEVYRDPTDGRYGDVKTLRRGDEVSPRSFPDVVLGVDEILGPIPNRT